MFETEDMLPRPPPRPSAPPMANGDSIKPTVPEVSIIFGKQTNSNAVTQGKTTQQPQSYADWKKQVLPSVSYPTGLKDDITCNVNNNVITTRSTVFPLRTKILTSSATLPQAQNTIAGTMCPLTDRNYQPNLESLSIQPVVSPLLNSYTQNSEQRRSVDSLSQRSSTYSVEHVLTICASTQTDFQTLTNENLKQDFGHVINAIKELQEEQRQMRRLMETFILQQKQQQQKQQIVSSVFCCDMAIQCDILKDAPSSNNSYGNSDSQPHKQVTLENVPPSQSPFQIEGGTIHQALPNVKIYSPTVRPTAQSTQYRVNTPINTNIKQTPIIPNATNNQFTNVLPKPSTEKSMVMNELALKYLPSDKLNEFMQDTQITPPTTVGTGTATPLREIDNFSKAPTDISTASYRYLRKYRLLPQQQQQNQQIGNSTPPQNGFHTPPTYNHQKYQQDSPINIVGTTNDDSPHLDLEHIRRQPKFL